MGAVRPARARQASVREPPPWERLEREAAAENSRRQDAERAQQGVAFPAPFDRPRVPASSPGPAAGPGSRAAQDEEGPLGKACWAVDSPGHPGRWPALLLEWKRDEAEGGWIGRIVVVGGSAQDRRPVEMWVSGRYLRPA